MKRLIFFCILIFFSSLYSQQDQIVTVQGDSLVGKVVDGKNIREVIGNVVITQEDFVINCDKAIQYIVSNEILLIGNVVVTQDTLTLQSARAYYYGDEQIAESDTAVYLTQPGLELTADRGKYFLEEERADFFGNVVLKDSLMNLQAQELIYFRESEKLRAVNDVKVSDSTSIIYADSLVHFRNEQISNAFFNVKVDNFSSGIIIYCDTLINRNKEKYSRLTGEPVFIRTDTTSSGEIDSLIIASVMMESHEDSTRTFVATDSVRILRGDFASVNEKSVLHRENEVIETIKLPDGKQPVLWYENSQLVGDSVFIHLKNDQLDFIDIKNNSIIISDLEDYQWRYNQIAGEEIKMFFNDSTISRTEVDGNVLSIYYLFEEGKPNGLLKSSAKKAKIIFEDGTVVDVRLYGSPNSEYHPESLVKGKTREFILPLFKVYENRPRKSELRKLMRD